eukprot:9102982-Pyramimonas_sp.AAC.1
MLFTDASFADCITSSKSTAGVFAALLGPNAFFPVNAVCKKQTVASRSSTESESVVLDSALRLDGLPLLSFWKQWWRLITPAKRRRHAWAASDAPLRQYVRPWPPKRRGASRRLARRPHARGSSPSRRQLPLKTELPAPPKGRTISHEGTVLHVDPEPARESSSPNVHLIVLEDNQA